MPNVGDKYIIEIEREFLSEPKDYIKDGNVIRKQSILYKIKGFDSLVFDLKGLKRLEKYEPKEEPKTYDKVQLGIGDEVCDKNDNIWVITGVENSRSGVTYLFGIDNRGKAYSAILDNVVGTGKHNSFLADAVESLKNPN